MNSTTPLFFPAATTGLMPYTGKTSGPSIIGQVEVSNSGRAGNSLPDGTLSDFERLLAQITGSDAQKALFSGTQANGQPASSPFTSVLGSQTSADGMAPEVLNPYIPSTSPYTVWSEQVQTSLGSNQNATETTSAQFEMDDRGRLLISAQLLSEIFAKLKTLQNKEARESADPSSQTTVETVNSLKAAGAVADIQEPNATTQKGASLANLSNLVQVDSNQSATSTATSTDTSTQLTALISELDASGETTGALAEDSLATTSLSTTSLSVPVSDTSSEGADVSIPESSANTPLTITADSSTVNQASTDTSSSEQVDSTDSEVCDITNGNAPYIALTLQAILATWNQSQTTNSTAQTTPNGTAATDSTSQSLTINSEPVPSNSATSNGSTQSANQTTKTTLASTGTTTPAAQNTGAATNTPTTSTTESVGEKPVQPESATTAQQTNPVSKSENLYLRIPLDSLPEPLRQQGQGLVLHISAAASSSDNSAKGLGTQVSYNGETFNVEVLTEQAMQSKDSSTGEFPEKGQPNMLKMDMQSFLKGEANGTSTPIATESEFAKAQRELVVETHRERKNLPPEAAKAEKNTTETVTEAKADRAATQVQESGRTSAQSGDGSAQSTHQTQSTQQTQTTSSAAAAREAIERYQQIQQQVVRSVNSSIGEGRSHVTIRLVPESLGQVDVRLTLDSGVLTARLWANNQETRQLLEQHANHLRASLEESGVRVDRVTVARESAERNGYQREQSDQGRSFAQNRQQSNQQQQRNAWNEESRTLQREQPNISFEDISAQESLG